MIDRGTAARHAARGLYADDDCEFDHGDSARVVHLDEQGTGVEGAAWVQCWRFVPAEAIEAVFVRAVAGAPTPT